VHISFCHNPTPDPYDEDSIIIIEYHFYISDDCKHDFEFVQHYLKLHWQNMVEQGYSRQWHWVWSDNCASQFKSIKPWYFVFQYPNLIRGCKML